MNRLPPLGSLARNALSLMATTGLTSVLGLAFWLVAARRYSTESVGRSSAEIAGATLVATLAALNIGAVLTRLLPAAGIRTRWFVLRCYLVTIGLAVLIGLGAMALGLGTSFLGDSFAERAAFVVAGVLLLVFTLQDGVLIGLRRSPVVLVENGAFAAVKLLALVLLASALPDNGIVVAWVGPVAVAVLIVTVYLFTVVIPEHEKAADGGAELPPRSRVVSFVSAEYAKSVLSTGTTWVLPLLVTAQLGSVQEAYFWIPWLINYSAVQLPYGISAAYVVESAFEGEQSHRTLKQSLRIGAGVVALCMFAEFFIVPLLLHLAGPGYAENGTAVIRILALALPFSAMNALYGTFAWMEQRMWRLVMLQVANVLVLITGSWLFMDDWGINAVAIWYLISQMVLGLGSLPPIMRRLRAASERSSQLVTTEVVPGPGGAATVDVLAVDDSRLP